MMSTIESSRRQTELDIARDGLNDGVATRIFLQPIAAPSILGLFGFAGATFVVASNLAGWWGTSESGLALAPFAAMFGGLAQFLAGMWAYRARDAVSAACAWYVATAMMLAAAAGAVVLPLGKFSRAANRPGGRVTRPIELEWAEPGGRMGPEGRAPTAG